MLHVLLLVHAEACIRQTQWRALVKLWELHCQAALLLQHNASVNYASKDGNTPLHLAIQEGRIQVAKILLSGGADTTKLNNKGKRPLDSANPSVLAALNQDKGDAGPGAGYVRAPALRSNPTSSPSSPSPSS